MRRASFILIGSTVGVLAAAVGAGLLVGVTVDVPTGLVVGIATALVISLGAAPVVFSGWSRRWESPDADGAPREVRVISRPKKEPSDGTS